MRFTYLTRVLLAAVAAVLLGGTMLAATPSASADSKPSTPTLTATTASAERLSCRATCWGAISINLKTGFYSKINYPTKARAIREAQQYCKNQSNGQGVCRKAAWFRNSCGAVAYRTHNGQLVEWAGAQGNTKRQAVRNAKRKVRGPGTERLGLASCTAN